MIKINIVVYNFVKGSINTIILKIIYNLVTQWCFSTFLKIIINESYSLNFIDYELILESLNSMVLE